MTTNSRTPRLIGCAITRPDIMILNMPTPIMKALAHRWPPIPCMIPAIPMNNRANPPKNIKNNMLNNGYANTKMEKAIAKAPSPILLKREDEFL